MRNKILVCGMLILAASAASTFADLQGLFLPGLDHPAIQYHTRPTNDPVAQLNLDIQSGKTRLKFDGAQGYLRSVLEALRVPVVSQMVTFSKNSVQSYRISPKNPRTLFFNDAVTVGWVRGGFIELAAEDPSQGVIFYTLSQQPADKPQFKRDDKCLTCHESLNSVGVPGMLVRSMMTAPDGNPLPWLGNNVTDHRTPMAQRWGGWYVTGNSGSVRHLGNAMVADTANPESAVTAQTLNLESLKGKFDTDAYLSPYSDIVALMVFEHQMHMTNLLTRIGWEARFASYEAQSGNRKDGQTATIPTDLNSPLSEDAKEIVDYMLFVDEVPLGGRIRGTSGFTEKFSSEGPFDGKGRSLRQFDLQHRMMRYPCSYMIYSDAFDALPLETRDAIYERMWQILSGKEKDKRYTRLNRADRQAIVGILRETKKSLPAYFQSRLH
ncbi:MAG TPA: hypothetical protein VN774_01880 [Candidatus Limnocylindrales bacterium]|nr:hypothetical protein [Candidatus Limnocylindrales bacterium]